MKTLRDFTKKGYIYYKLCEDCNKKISTSATFCKSCAKKGMRNSNFKGGYLRKDGYRTIGVKLEHRVVWEKHFGKIPKGCDIHHKNNDKQDNRIKNLEMIKKTLHKSLKHIKEKNGIMRICSDCHKLLELTKNFPPRKNKLGIIAGYRGRCKDCWRKKEAKKVKEWWRKKVIKWREEGLCTSCGKIREDKNFTFCAKCRKDAKKYQRIYKEKKKCG